MKLIASLAVVAVLGLTSVTPAFALYCANEGPGVGFSFDLSRDGFSVLKRSNNEEQNQFDLMRLRQAGVNATSVERWNGCLRAFVRTGSGETMQFYDPASLRRLQ